MLKYCDRCKWDSVRCSKGIPEGTDEDRIIFCPDCGYELHDADGIDDIP